MRDGRIVQIGSPVDIVLNPDDDYVEEFIQGIRCESVLTASSLMSDPISVVTTDQGAEDALKLIQENDCACVFVVDRQDKYLGWISLQYIARAVKSIFRTSNSRRSISIRRSLQ